MQLNSQRHPQKESRMLRRRSRLAAIALAWVFSAVTTHAGFPVRTVALSDWTYPGPPPFEGADWSLGSFPSASINASGDVAFFSQNPRLSGVWITRADGTLENVARTDQPIEALGDLNNPNNSPVWQAFNPTVQLADTGEIGFSPWAQQRPTAVFGPPNALSAIRPGDPLPGAQPDDFLSQINDVYSIDIGSTGIATVVVQSLSDDRGFWTNRNGTPELVNAIYQVVSFRGPDSHRLDWEPDAEYVVASDGSLAFYGSLLDNTDFQPNFEGILTDRSGELDFVAKLGDTAPGSSGTFSRFGKLRVTAQGQVAFRAEVLAKDGSRQTGIWLEEQSGQLRAAAVSGQPATGQPEGVRFEENAFSPGIRFSNRSVLYDVNDRGEVAFVAAVAEGDNGQERRVGLGIWAERTDGELEAVAINGAPVATDDDPFLLSLLPNKDSPIEFNNVGQVALISFVTSSTRGGASAVLVSDPTSGVLTAALTSGDTLRVPGESGEELRTILRFEPAGFPLSSIPLRGNLTISRQFNDRGEFLFRAQFTDGTSGLFVVTVPEPGTMALLVFAGGGLFGRARTGLSRQNARKSPLVWACPSR